MREGDLPDRGGLQGARPRAWQLGGPASELACEVFLARALNLRPPLPTNELSASRLEAEMASREKVPLVSTILKVLPLVSQVRLTKSGLETPSLARAEDTEIKFVDRLGMYE